MNKAKIKQNIIKSLRHLDINDRLRVLEEVKSIINRQDKLNRKKRSLLELAGLGEEIWKDVDIEKYIKSERETWEREWNS